MKKLFLTLAIIVMGHIAASAADTLVIARKTSQLSIPLKKGSIECSIDAQLPVTGGETMYSNLTQRLVQAVAKATGIKNMEKASDIQMPAMSVMESSFVKHIVSQMETQVRDAHAYELTLDVLIQREYETAQLVTFRIEVTYYGIDNKRHQLTDHVSLLKQTGKPMQWNDVLNKKTRGKFCKAAAQSLFGYFGVMDFINLKNALKDGQNLTEDNFPLPEAGVAITSDGFFITYAPGEICDPERGQPLGTIRLQQAWSYLTANAKKWVK